MQRGFLLVVVTGAPSWYRLLRESHRHQPLPGREHSDLVHAKCEGHVIAHPELLTKHRRLRIRLVANTRPDVVLGCVLVSAIKNVPKSSLRIDPHGRVVASSPVLRFTHGLRNGEGLRPVITPGQKHGVFGRRLLRPAGEPRGEHPAPRGALQSGDPLP